MSSNVASGSRERATTASDTAFFATRPVLWKRRKMRLVARSSFARRKRFTLSWMGASTVAQKRVPMLMPSAPSASAATRPRPSPKPPLAISGMVTLSAAAGMSTRPGTSSSPGWPAHSKPSMETMSTPMRCAERAWRTAVHLWITVMPWALKSSTCSCGLWPAVSTMVTPLSMMARR